MKNNQNLFRFNGRNKFEISLSYEGTELFEDAYMKKSLKSALKAIESVYGRFLKNLIYYKQFQNLNIEVMNMENYGSCSKIEHKILIDSMCYKTLESVLFHELVHYMLGYLFWRPYESYINTIEEGFVRRVEDLFYQQFREENTFNFLFHSTNDYFGYSMAELLINEKVKWQKKILYYATSLDEIEKQEKFFQSFTLPMYDEKLENFFVDNMDCIILNTSPNEFGKNLPDGIGVMYREYFEIPLTLFFNSLKVYEILEIKKKDIMVFNAPIENWVRARLAPLAPLDNDYYEAVAVFLEATYRYKGYEKRSLKPVL